MGQGQFTAADLDQSQAAPAATTGQFTAADLDQSAAPQKDFSARVGERIGNNVKGQGRVILSQLPDAVNAAIDHPNLPHSLSDVPDYLANALGKPFQMVHQLYKDYRDDPANLVGDIITAKAMGPEGDDAAAGAKPAAAAASKAPTASVSIPSAITDAVGIASPKLARMMKSVQAGKWEGLLPDRMVHAINLAKGASKAAPDPATMPTEMPNVYGTPRGQWGETVGAPAPFPERPPTEILQANALSRGGRPAPPNPSDALKTIPVHVEPQPAPPTPTPEGMGPSAEVNTLPHTLNGESALRQILTGQDNANLLKIAKSRGINVTKEAALKPGTADNLLINKIVDDFSPDELDEIRAQYLENTRFRHAFGDIGPEAWKTLSLQTYFPDLKIPQTMLDRTTKAIAGQNRLAPEINLPPGQRESDLTPLLQESVRRARAARQPAN